MQWASLSPAKPCGRFPFTRTSGACPPTLACPRKWPHCLLPQMKGSQPPRLLTEQTCTHGCGNLPPPSTDSVMLISGTQASLPADDEHPKLPAQQWLTIFQQNGYLQAVPTPSTCPSPLCQQPFWLWPCVKMTLPHVPKMICSLPFRLQDWAAGTHV